MEIDPAAVSPQDAYKYLIATVLPRPIAFVSSLSREGRRNLAPFSFFTAICANPLTIAFCPMIRGATGLRKDTLNNVIATGEFVVNIVTEVIGERMNLTSGEYPPEVDEFEVSGLTPTPSVKVAPPSVLESPVHLECVTHQVVTLSDEPWGGSLVIGRVVHMHIADAVMDGSRVDLGKLKPIARMSGNWYARITDRFEMTRPPNVPPSKG